MSQQAELTKEILVKEPAPSLQREISTTERAALTTGIPSISEWNSGRSRNDSLAISIVKGVEKNLSVESQQRVNAIEGREQKPPFIEIKSFLEDNEQGLPLGNEFQETEVRKRTQPSHKNDKYPDALSTKSRSQGSPPGEYIKRLPHPKLGIYPGIRLA